MMEREIEESQNGTNPRYPDFRQFLEVREEILQKSLSKNSDSMIDSAVSFLPLSIFHPNHDSPWTLFYLETDEIPTFTM